jgi:hypothetical protein
MYASQRNTREILQGDVYAVRMGFAVVESLPLHGEVEPSSYSFQGSAAERWVVVLSHSCDSADALPDKDGTVRNTDRDPVVVSPLRETNDYVLGLIKPYGGLENLNNIDDPVFYQLFHYPRLEGFADHSHIVNFSEASSLQKRFLRPKTKLAEIDDNSRLALRVKLQLHFGRGDDRDHPLADLIAHAQKQEARSESPAVPTSL